MRTNHAQYEFAEPLFFEKKVKNAGGSVVESIEAKNLIVSHNHINILPSHVFLASHKNRLTVSKPRRSWKCALGARKFSELGGVQTTQKGSQRIPPKHLAALPPYACRLSQASVALLPHQAVGAPPAVPNRHATPLLAFFPPPRLSIRSRLCCFPYPHPIPASVGCLVACTQELFALEPLVGVAQEHEPSGSRTQWNWSGIFHQGVLGGDFIAPNHPSPSATVSKSVVQTLWRPHAVPFVSLVH